MLVCDIEDEEDGLASSVVGAGDGPEALLAGGVPDLELNILVVDDGSFKPEIDPNCGKVVLLELVFREPDQDRRFPHSRVPDYYSFVQMIVLLYHFISIYYTDQLKTLI